MCRANAARCVIQQISSYIVYALRRILEFPSRLVISMLVCCTACISIFNALAEISLIDETFDRLGRLNGYPGYRISVSKTHLKNGTTYSSLMPQTVLENIKTYIPTFAFQLRTQMLVVDNLHSKGISANVIFAYLGEQLGKQSSFPECYLIEPGSRKIENSNLLIIAANWRCIRREIPQALFTLKEDRTVPAIIFPFSSFNDIVGQAALNNVDIAWIGVDDFVSFRRLLKAVEEKANVELEIHHNADVIHIGAAALSLSTKIWSGVASILLIIGFFLYIQGIAGALRQEMAIRICLGQSLRTVVLWLITDVLTQSLLLLLSSILVGAAVFACFIGSLDINNLFRIFLGITSMLVLFACLISVIVVNFTFHLSRVIQMTR